MRRTKPLNAATLQACSTLVYLGTSQLLTSVVTGSTSLHRAVIPPGGFLALLLSQEDAQQQPALPPAVRDRRNIDLSEVYREAYARQLAYMSALATTT